MTREELLAQYAAGERDFQGVLLQYISLDGVQLEGVNFTGAIFNSVSFNTAFVDCEDVSKGFSETIFIECNFSYSEWWFCHIPKLARCNLQYAVTEGCLFLGKFIKCDWRSSHFIGAFYDDVVFEECDLREIRTTKKSYPMFLFDPIPESGFMYKNTFDKDEVFRSGIHCNLPDPDDPIPF
ncbi:MAG: pentapeptide repeat-containing protein [Hydrococcus sp. SU_1_0]|nr:pentapeptide repeat-containing protein [Hydrococcus sp. SU_1_0]